MRRLVAAFAIAFVLLYQPVASHCQTAHSDATAAKAKPAHLKPNCTNNGTYVNSRGETVHRPENCSAQPEGATAQCRDGSYSFSRNRRGTCSHHGGVAKWL
jgi:hypothetical protein